jgi:hypothetical protein
LSQQVFNTVRTNHTYTNYINSSDWTNVTINNPQISWTEDETTTYDFTAKDFIIPDMKLNNHYESINDFFNLFTSAGRLSGGMIYDEGSQKINVSSGNGTIRIADDDVSQVKFFQWDAKTNIPVPTDSVIYLGVEYNGGSPQVVNKTTDTWDYDTEFPLGSVINQKGDLYIKNDLWWVGDGLTNIIERFKAEGITRDESIGGLILSYTGTRNPTLSSGTIWSLMNEFSISAKDCSGTDTFYEFYRDGSGGYNRKGPLSQWNNTHYDDGSGTLTTLNNNWYANIWVFVEIDGSNGGQLMLIYPQNQYANPSSAEAEELPTFPQIWYDHGILVVRILIQEGVDAPVEVQSSFVTQFNPAQATDHGNLGGLTDDDHTQYLLTNGSRSLTGNWDAGSYNITADYYLGDGSYLTGIETGNPFDQSLNTTDNVEFENVTTNDITIGYDGLSQNHIMEWWVENGYNGEINFMETNLYGVGIDYDASDNRLYFNSYDNSLTPTSQTYIERTTGDWYFETIHAEEQSFGNHITLTNNGISGYMSYQNTGSDSLFNPNTDNWFYEADQKFSVTSSGFNSPNPITYFFDDSYDQATYNTISAYTNATINIDLTGKGLFSTSSGVTYPYGDFILTFYGTTGTGLDNLDFWTWTKQRDTDVTADSSTNTFTDNGHGLDNNDYVQIDGGTASPTGINESKRYYVVNSDTNTFQVSETYGGTPVTFSDDGTDVIYHTWHTTKDYSISYRRIKINQDGKPIYKVAIPTVPYTIELELHIETDDEATQYGLAQVEYILDRATGDVQLSAVNKVQEQDMYHDWIWYNSNFEQLIEIENDGRILFYNSSDTTIELDGSDGTISAFTYVDWTEGTKKTNKQSLDAVVNMKTVIDDDGTAVIDHSTLDTEAKIIKNISKGKICEEECKKLETFTLTNESGKIEKVYDIECKEVNCFEEFVEKEGRNLNIVWDWYRGAITELKEENDMLKSELCKKDNTYSWCKVGVDSI